MFGWMLMGCDEPPLLDRVATAYGDEIVATSATSIGLFVSVGAIVAEPCAADNVDTYTLVGEGYHAFRVGAPVVTVSESGERTYTYGTVAFNGDNGELTLTSDAARHAWTARYSGQLGSMVANYAASDCEVDEAGVTTLASVAGTGTYTLADGSEQAIAVSGGAEAALAWAPSTSSVPTSGSVNWKVTEDKETLELDDASTIDLLAREWAGLAAGTNWSTPVVVTLP